MQHLLTASEVDHLALTMVIHDRRALGVDVQETTLRDMGYALRDEDGVEVGDWWSWEDRDIIAFWKREEELPQFSDEEMAAYLDGMWWRLARAYVRCFLWLQPSPPEGLDTEARWAAIEKDMARALVAPRVVRKTRSDDE